MNFDITRAQMKEIDRENTIVMFPSYYAPGGAFLPCYPSVMAVDVPTMFAVMEELNRYGAEWAEKNAREKSN